MVHYTYAFNDYVCKQFANLGPRLSNMLNPKLDSKWVIYWLQRAIVQNFGRQPPHAQNHVPYIVLSTS